MVTEVLVRNNLLFYHVQIICVPLYTRSFVRYQKQFQFQTKLQLETQQLHTLLVQLPEEGRFQSMSIF